MATPTLNTFAKQFVYEKFDAHNEEHLQAYLCLSLHGRQHPTLRFYLEEPYQSVPSLMNARIAEAYTAQYKGLASATAKLIDYFKAKSIQTVAVETI